MRSEERSWLLIARAISGDISVEEQGELDRILFEKPDLRVVFDDLNRMRITRPDDLPAEAKQAMDRGLDKLDRSLIDEKRFIERHLFGHDELRPLAGRNYKNRMVAAAIAAILLCGIFIYRPFKNLKPLPQQVFAVHYGKRMHTILPDGSIVWLNSGSSIKYEGNLVTNGKREVTLSGEAYFDVKHDSRYPFIVHAGKLNVVVLGTAFNVKAYKEDAFIETTLIRGKVEIMNDAKPGANIILLPNEKVTVDVDKFQVKKTKLAVKSVVQDSVAFSAKNLDQAPQTPNEAITETAWVSDKLTFKKEKFPGLAMQLERWYDVKITFDNNSYVTKQFTGTFKDQDINEVMRALQFTQPFHYAINNNEIHIW